MKRPFLLVSLSLTVASVLAQDQVQIQFQTDPVLIQTGSGIVFTVQTVSNILSMTWRYQGGVTLGLWTGGTATINPVAQFQGRVTITANQLQISSAQLRDAGNYTVVVIPFATTGLSPNSRSVQLRVFDGVNGISLFVPSVALENGNVSLSCTWTAGTEITVQWGKGGSAITADSRITISGGSLVMNPALRGDAGVYTCTVWNPVSAQTATKNLTVYYGPDTPVATINSPKNCVGYGNVLVGQTVTLTCTSNSQPPALFSWQYNGQPVTSGQPDSGVLSLQTSSTKQSGQYVCTARNSITGGTSQQSTDLAIVDICLNGGEVAGIVVGCFLAIIIIVLLIVFLVFLVRRRRTQQRQRNTVVVQKTNPNPRPIPQNPQLNGGRDLDQGPQPPLHTHSPDRLYRTQRENNSHTQPLNELRNSSTHQHNGQTHTNRLPNNAIQNTNSYPHNGFDNPAFTHTDAQNANTLLNTEQQQNPNILIQTGTGQGGTHPPAVQVSLNTLPRTTQSNNNPQMPTIHVNLNSFSTSDQQAQQDRSFPITNPANNIALQMQHNPTHSNPTMQSGQSYPNVPQLNNLVSTNDQSQPGLIPTGYTHFNNNVTSQRNANTQTYQQDPEPRRRADRNSRRHESTPSSARRQMPWDLLRGTPTYPSGTLQRTQTASEFTSDTIHYTSDHTVRPPSREARTPNTSQPQSQTASRRRTPPRFDPPSTDGDTWSHSTAPRRLSATTATQTEPLHHTQRSPHTQRESAQQDIRGSQNALRQETTRSNNPQALPIISQQASAGHSVVPQRPTAQHGLAALQGADTRALADPNHLQQAHMAQQQIAAPVHKPQGLGTHTQPAMDGASQPHLGATAPSHPSAQPNSSNLTQAALRAHTERAQVFQNRRQQTQAALHHPRPQQAQAPDAGAQRPPTPPPVIPLAQFQALPKDRNQHKSPARGPQMHKRHIPAAQQHLQAQQRPRHPTTMPTNHHHLPGNVHMHVNAHRHGHVHPRGHGHPAHFTHPQQQQAHRGRPR
ncbi:mediator of RNA polymerase II transcription subunit 15 isoform X2 [Melanotaenia boesemani]|uniref:mediator of RNA polymerase II transcription subunit 15 isoform X2 n=1 Tax=Melanotaenia boesemani TaxID=1250792 RepID=UPI001C04D8AD|nr:mediator of RNA polymerase II transcription subunit 15 isoform X2 [Melanotaenia boesemani]